MALHILATGGTFDKQYDAVNGTLGFGATHLPQLLQQARCQIEHRVSTVLLKDSLDMDDDDRAALLQQCRAVEEQHLVVIHGTDTMTHTARVLAEAALAKTIVLTGAMVPATCAGSDAIFNLGAAVALAQILEPGVYIAMNGVCFPWHQVRKNRALGRFESTIA
ncbi:MAG TPA: asparaginase domain-containing protein [Hyphomicrobiales bacterium]|nr:asparaginase domain-containing protein [Hyphomicrobiales bacterium]